jgi:WD40 repeat protein
MSIRSIALATTLSALFAVLVGCNKSQPTPAKTSTTAAQGGANAPTSPDDPNADVGEALYNKAADPVMPPPAPTGTDPIAIACSVQYEDRQQLSAEVDGKIELVATPMTFRNGRYEFQLKDEAGAPKTIVYPDEKHKDRYVFHPRDEKHEFPYWKLTDGDRVSDGQVLCLLDDQLWLAKKKAAEDIMKASADALKSAEEGVKLAQEKVDLDIKGNKSVALADTLNDKITYERFVENKCQSIQSIAKAEGDLQEAEVNLRKHQIKCRVEGIIRSIAKRPGEFVHAGEKILEIQSTEKVRLEGNMDVQYFNRVKRQMQVWVEPAVPKDPQRSHERHRAEVAGIAVTGHAKRPLVVSASLDGSALLWDPNLNNDQTGVVAAHALPHPVGVRTVACTPMGKTPVLVVTGAEDGKVRMWDVTDLNKLPKTPWREPADAHSSGVHAIAISPDGKFAATAAGREVFIWDLESGQKRYALPAEHRDSITSVSFTPQTQLVTTAKDNSLKVWKLGAAKAAVAKTVEHRSGVVETLGVSPDGGRVLFDQDKSRLDLINLSDAQTNGQIINVGAGISFSTLAIFAPDYNLASPIGDKPSPYTIATAGGDGDLKGGVQVWQLPRSGERAAEVARLMTPGRVPVTCAAFSPSKDTRFLVVGTERGTVHVWTPPSGPQPRLEGRITNIESTDPRFVTVRVEMPNTLGLLDRSAATVIVNPTR